MRCNYRHCKQKVSKIQSAHFATVFFIPFQKEKTMAINHAVLTAFFTSSEAYLT